jgi:hypothetical protein
MSFQALLEQIKADGGRIPEGQTLVGLTARLLPLLGSPDAHLRDELALELLWGWILSGMYSAVELQQIARQLRSNLREGVGQDGDDSVYLRSFSVLLLSVIVRADNKENVLPADEVKQTLQAVLDYFGAELDWRGREPECGWIHAVAHAADCFLALAGSRHLQAEDLLQMLQVMQARLLRPSSHVLLAEEDERLARAVRGIVARGLLSQQNLSDWLAGFLQPAPSVTWKKRFLSGDEGARAYQNCKQLLRSLYWQSRSWISPMAEETATLAAETLREMQLYNYEIR